MAGREVKCPACGADVEMESTELREFDGGMVTAVVVTDPGTFHAHVRDAHPVRWAEMREARRKMNANPFFGGSPRKVDGTFLMQGEDVGDIAVRAAS